LVASSRSLKVYTVRAPRTARTTMITPLLVRRRRAVRLWLIAVAVLVFATVVVGGATRLTESGLSITEWKPVTGTLPPLTEAAWQAEFDKYKTIPQFQKLNSGMTLAEFKTIFWWEWAHRLLGRVIGAAFLLPFLWFLWRGWIEPALKPRLWGIFALGALQGGIGWWMVASGLVHRTDVSQYRLALHLTLACIIFAAIVWTARRLAPCAEALDAPRRTRLGAGLLLVLVLVQIYLGALVAGLDAGLTYNTWPLMDGQLVPPAADLFRLAPAWRNPFENVLTVQFDHRLAAYVLWLLAILHAVDAARSLRGHPAVYGAIVLAVAITLQAAFGIATLLLGVPIGLALLHQAMAVVVLMIAVIHAERLALRRAPQDAPLAVAVS
jgi:cytochrome c oxidase assembly protein subunit 15